MRKIAVLDKQVCVACGVCVKTCPKDAISIYRGCYAMVNGDRCVGCGLCTKSCPVGCIVVKERGAVK